MVDGKQNERFACSLKNDKELGYEIVKETLRETRAYKQLSNV
jgi:hypothetical protein